MSDTDTEAAQAPARRHAASRRHPGSRRRGLEIAGLVLGMAAGVGVAATWLIPSLPHLSGPPPVNSPPVVVNDSAGSFTSPGSMTAPDPAALDAEWAAYSDRSGCADWAGGDGVSAIRLNSSQLAWFFSDTFIGPAGPTTGFSHISGFAHAASTFPFVPLGTVIASFDAGQLSSAGHRSRYGATSRPTLVRLPSYTPPAAGPRSCGAPRCCALATRSTSTARRARTCPTRSGISTWPGSR